MSFAMRASTNALATPDNLARWGKVVDATCKLCYVPGQPTTRSTGTLGHILNNCPKMLDRYEWRHNGVLAYMYQMLMENKPVGLSMQIFKVEKSMEEQSLQTLWSPPTDLTL
jgi:hypothetical protein